MSGMYTWVIIFIIVLSIAGIVFLALMLIGGVMLIMSVWAGYPPEIAPHDRAYDGWIKRDDEDH